MLSLSFARFLSSGPAATDPLAAAVACFKTPLRYAMGYGSGVFKQEGYSPADRPQVDMILAVDDARTFHAATTARFPSHYSALKMGGADGLARVQSMAAGVYFNPFVTLNGQVVKYGVVEYDRMCLDLENWDSLYLAGRMQKPVKAIVPDPNMHRLNQLNLQNAVNVASMMSRTERLTEGDLYRAITGLSYKGDPRIRLGGENPHKIANIVAGQYEKFQELYRPYLLEARVAGDAEWMLSRPTDTRARARMIQTLPLAFRRRVYQAYTSQHSSLLATDEEAQTVLNGGRPSIETDSPFALAIATDPKLPRALARTVVATVASPALGQTVKGLFSAGLVRSVKYAWEKKAKNWHAKKLV